MKRLNLNSSCFYKFQKPCILSLVLDLLTSYERETSIGGRFHRSTHSIVRGSGNGLIALGGRGLRVGNCGSFVTIQHSYSIQ